MDNEHFDELVESVKQGGEILRKMKIDKMTPAELNDAVAVEIMNFRKEGTLPYYEIIDNRCQYVYKWNPANNDSGHTDCYLAESRMREMGMEGRYAEILMRKVCFCWNDCEIDEDNQLVIRQFGKTFDLIHATCKQRCRAMLQTVREANDD